jgi:hypothetical protein
MPHEKRPDRDAVPAFSVGAAIDVAACCQDDCLVPAASVQTVLNLIRLAGLGLLAQEVPGAAAGGSDEGFNDLFHFRLLDCFANSGKAYDFSCYATVI